MKRHPKGPSTHAFSGGKNSIQSIIRRDKNSSIPNHTANVSIPLLFSKHVNYLHFLSL